MALVDYSDSDDSGIENAPAIKPSSKISKSTFQKVVDRSNPRKIRVSLPEVARNEDRNEDENPAKRVKTGGGGLSDFKSFLPPPKRTGQATSGSLGGGNGIRRGGLAAGVNLKTGAGPGFSRETATESQDFNTENYSGGNGSEDNTGGHAASQPSDETGQKPAEEVKLVGKPLMFKPLSVARNPAKKKKAQVASSITPSTVTIATPSTISKVEPSVQKPKVSLFSVVVEEDHATSISTGDYQPLIYRPGYGDDQDTEEPVTSTDENYSAPPQLTASASHNPVPGAQSLDDIASEMNLSAAERRQLFGRHKGNGPMLSATKIINFNTDEEYKHNEELRAAGEIVQHKTVRAIAPGKHSLKQLVNAAQSQKEALEESFASGKNNRAEASSRYGW
jgi:hypothetical protein